ncbi:MAG TPA: hypothetical protein VFX84_01490, partial [Candidatus Saccharimonadales bacterium]|nr:hypothetical protein [Candidatus Saccharimonadales bacterium]
AGAATQAADVLSVLGLRQHNIRSDKIKGGNASEQAVLDLMFRGISEGHELLEASGLDVSLFNQTLTMLELDGLIRPLGANNWAIA